MLDVNLPFEIRGNKNRPLVRRPVECLDCCLRSLGADRVFANKVLAILEPLTADEYRGHLLDFQPRPEPVIFLHLEGAGDLGYQFDDKLTKAFAFDTLILKVNGPRSLSASSPIWYQDGPVKRAFLSRLRNHSWLAHRIHKAVTWSSIPACPLYHPACWQI